MPWIGFPVPEKLSRIGPDRTVCGPVGPGCKVRSSLFLYIYSSAVWSADRTNPRCGGFKL